MVHNVAERVLRARVRLAGILVLGVALGLLAAGCGSSDSSSNDGGSGTTSAGTASVKGKSVVLVDCSDQIPWCHAYNETIAAGLDRAGVKLTTLTDPFDPAVQDQHMNQAIAQHPDAIILLASNSSSIIPAINRAKSAGIPVINTDAPLAEGGLDAAAFEVIADHEAMGRYAAEGLVDGLQREGVSSGNVFVAAGALAAPPAQARLIGFKQVMKRSPQYRIVSVQDTSWDQTKAAQAATQIIAQYRGQGGIQGAYGMNDLLALGVVKAAQQAGVEVGVENRGIVVVGGNCLAPGVPAVRQGLLHTSGTQTPTTQGAVVVEHLLEFLAGKQQQKTITVPEYKITRENLDQYAKECTF